VRERDKGSVYIRSETQREIHGARGGRADKRNEREGEDMREEERWDGEDRRETSKRRGNERGGHGRRGTSRNG
jgi:hypothetical protein